jgi:DNA-binding transcriptional MerR regulator
LTRPTWRRIHQPMRIGELAREVGVSADTVRFYERAGWLPRVDRADNGYREYSAGDADHLRLLIELRRLDIPLDDAARMARSCHSGHCESTTTELPSVIAGQRAEIAARIAGLRALDSRLDDLQSHLGRRLPTVASGEACCAAAAAVHEGCASCASA